MPTEAALKRQLPIITRFYFLEIIAGQCSATVLARLFATYITAKKTRSILVHIPHHKKQEAIINISKALPTYSDC